jgi:hypothetical protein
MLKTSESFTDRQTLRRFAYALPLRCDIWRGCSESFEKTRRVSKKLGEFGEFRIFFGVPTARRRRYLKKHPKNRISSKRAGRPAGIYA